MSIDGDVRFTLIQFNAISVYSVRLCIMYLSLSWKQRKQKTINKFRHYIHNKNKLYPTILTVSSKRKMKKWRNEEWTKVKINTQKINTHARFSSLNLFLYVLYFWWCQTYKSNKPKWANAHKRGHRPDETARNDEIV